MSKIPDVAIEVNGRRMPVGFLADLESVTVQEDLDALSMFTLVLNNWDDNQLTVTWSESDLLAIGAEVTIKLGYLGDLRTVMMGVITGLEPTFTAEQPPMLTVRGYDHGHRLARGRRTRTFAGMTDSQIAGQIAQDAGLTAEVRDTRVVLDYVVQSNASGLEFLRRRAALIGYEVYVQDRVLHFRPPQHDKPALLTMRLNRDLTEFAPRLNSLTQVGKHTVRGWDPASKQAIVGAAYAGIGQVRMGGLASGAALTDNAFGKAAVSGVDTPVQSRAEADLRAAGQFTGHALTFIEGEAECLGNPALRAGAVIGIEGAGATFSGSYYLTSVTHESTQGGEYRTQLGLRRNSA